MYETEASSSSVASGRERRKKSMSLKAREYHELNCSLLRDDSDSDPFAVSQSSDDENVSIDLHGESNTEDEESNTENEDESSDEDLSFSTRNVVVPKYSSKISIKKHMNKTKGKKKDANQTYAIKSDEYFYHNLTKKNKTSNHTLDHLKKPRLSQEELQKLMSNLTVTKIHKKHLDKINEHNISLFDKWMCLLHEGFNVLLYGLGSKRTILNDFHKEHLNNFPVIVVNGFFPSLTMKEILDSIICEILEIDTAPTNIFEASDIIIEEFKQYPNIHLYLIVHNIEGEMLRTNLKNQTVLSNLAAVDNIHLIASIDHINAPLIWDQNRLSKFNFTWWDVTTFLPYKDETSFETSIMISNTGSLALSSLRNVFLSLTSNSKGIYLIVAKYQLQNTSQFYQGMLFKDLYWSCREAFLVSSDLALRAQLTEFVDHKMMKIKRSVDGAEYLVIPIPNNLLQQFINDQS